MSTSHLKANAATPAAGLSAIEAAMRLERDGPNIIIPERRGRRFKRLVGPLADPMVALLLLAAPTYLLIGETTDAIVAFVALGPIAAVGWLLESRAQRTLDQLRRLTAPTATVVRDGVDQVVPVETLVVGDFVRVHEGDVVPADAAGVELTQLLVDESALTGESLPAGKQVGTGDEESMVWAGTTVLSGRALLSVTTTGASTQYGRIGTLVATRPPLTPLQHGLVRLVRALAVVAAVFSVAVVLAELAHGDGWGEAVIAGVSLAIAAIPEEFSMIYTLYLALGAWRLAQEHALVRSLPSVETLGSTTVICTDKTGTLTHGRLAVAGIWTQAGRRNDGGSLSNDEVELLEAAVLACEPDPYDPLDVAIVDYSRRHDIDTTRLHASRLARDWPFDPAGKYLTHVWQSPHDDSAMRVAAKGALEGILAHTVTEPGVCDEVANANAAFTAEGMRVIAVAAGQAAPTSTTRREDEVGLRLLGLVAFSDPIRDGVAEALTQCSQAGIRVIMITGDHPATAHAVAEGLGLPHETGGNDIIATGDDLDAADNNRLDDLVAGTNVFARTRPEQKHRLVRALRRHGAVVAMTGDGINDAPALREADIGVAMGQRGTEVAREAASLVLLDDNFATIVVAVRDGRRIFDNLTRAFAYLIAFHPPLLIGALTVPLLGKPLLFLPIHLVVLELLLHPVVSLVFQADPPDPDAMHRPPRLVGDALRLRSLARPYAVGTVLAVAVLAVYLTALEAWPEDQARALAFASLLASQPVLLLSMRSPDRPLWGAGRRRLTRTVGVVTGILVAAMFAVVYVPPLAGLLHLEPFPARWWAVVLIMAAGTAWSEPLKKRATLTTRGPSESSGRNRVNVTFT